MDFDTERVTQREKGQVVVNFHCNLPSTHMKRLDKVSLDIKRVRGFIIVSYPSDHRISLHNDIHDFIFVLIIAAVPLLEHILETVSDLDALIL